jgi:hypothetical protein
MRPSPEVERLLPGEEDVAFYEEHGYYVTPKVLPDDVIDAAIRGAERHWAGERDWRLPVSTGFGGLEQNLMCLGTSVRKSGSPLIVLPVFFKWHSSARKPTVATKVLQVP